MQPLTCPADSPSRLRQMGRSLLDLIFPACCAACGMRFVRDTPQPVRQPASDRLVTDRLPAAFVGEMVCPACLQAMQAIQAPLCTVCGGGFQSPHTHSHPCGDCQRTPPTFDQARSVAVYGGALREMVHRFKYQSMAQLSQGLGLLLGWGAGVWYGDRHHDLIVPVPLHGSRLRQRGFNQAELMVRRWISALRKAFPEQALPAIMADNLYRMRATAPQNQLNRSQRQANIHGAFGVRNPASFYDKSVLLVDDVFTTGATVSECARVLSRAGARRVDVLTLARA